MTGPTHDLLDSDRAPAGVCAIGASAGGLDPLETFFASIPIDTGLAFVVIQHLSPDHESMMDSLLSRHTTMPIRQAADGDQLVRDHAYLIPPDRVLTVEGNTLRLSDRDRSATKSPSPHPIDAFFASLAEQWGPNAAAVVLSGTGNDGAAGTEAVRRAGGLTLAQDASASFEGMPTAADRRGFIDAMASVPALIDHIVGFFERGERPTSANQDARYTALEETIIADLVATCGINFRDYKRGTVRRRIQHRMNILGLDTLQEFTDVIRADVDERNELTNDILIGVTSFFRDPEVYAHLEETVVDKLLNEAVADGRSARAWVVGCATGQEAYSLAITLVEARERLGLDVPIQIFATDVHEVALAKAGSAIYTELELKNVAPDRQERFFRQDNGVWRVREEVRALVTFARHNMLTDTPFTKIDLVSCRNSLIYFLPTAQQRALWALGFALRHAGVLLLGTSESPGFLTPDFEPIVASARIFVKTGDSAIKSFRRRMGDGLGSLGPEIALPRSSPGPDQTLLRAYDQILDQSFAAGLILDGRNEILHVIGDAKNWLEHPSGRPSLDVNALVRDPSLRLAIGSLARELQDSEQSESQRVVNVDDDRGPSQLLLTGRQIRVGSSSYRFISGVPVESRSPVVTTDMAVMFEPQDMDRISQLESDLSYARESLQSALEEQETSNEELNAANEELIASNEELQSSNEELSALNEELRTLNDEHHRRLQEVLELTADLEQILTSTEIGILLLNRDRSIRRFSDPARDYFHLMASDLGRPFSHIRTRFDSEGFAEAIDEVMDGADSKTFRVTMVPDGDEVLISMRPYDLLDGGIGVAITAQALGAAAESSNQSLLRDFNRTNPLRSRIFDATRRQLMVDGTFIEGGESFDEAVEISGANAPDLVEAFNEIDRTGKHISVVHTVAGDSRVAFFWPFMANGAEHYGVVSARTAYLQSTMASWVESQTVGVIADMLGVGAAVVERDGTVGQRFSATLDNGYGAPLDHPENLLALSHIVASSADLGFHRFEQEVNMFVRGDSRRVTARGMRLGSAEESPYLAIVLDLHHD